MQIGSGWQWLPFYSRISGVPLVDTERSCSHREKIHILCVVLLFGFLCSCLARSPHESPARDGITTHIARMVLPALVVMGQLQIQIC